MQTAIVHLTLPESRAHALFPSQNLLLKSRRTVTKLALRAIQRQDMRVYFIGELAMILEPPSLYEMSLIAIQNLKLDTRGRRHADAL